MNDKRDYVVNDYSALNKFAEDEIRYANQTSRVHNAQAFGIYAKYASLLILAIGLLIFFAGFFYWFYKVKPDQLIYNENNYTMDPNEVVLLFKDELDIVRREINTVEDNLNKKFVIISDEVNGLNNSFQSDISTLVEDINSLDKNTEVIIDNKNTKLKEEINDFIILQNKQLEDNIRGIFSSQSELNDNVISYNDDKLSRNNNLLPFDQTVQIIKEMPNGSKNNNTFKADRKFDSITDDDCDRTINPYCDLFKFGDNNNPLTVGGILEKLETFDYENLSGKSNDNKQISNNDDFQLIKKRSYKDIKDTDCDRTINPYCDLFKQPPGLSSKDNNRKENRNKSSYVIFQSSDVSLSGKNYRVENQWQYENGNITYPDTQYCSTNLAVNNFQLKQLKVFLYEVIGRSNPRIIYDFDNAYLDKNLFQELSKYCHYATDYNQSISGMDRTKNYYAIFSDNPKSTNINNTPHQVTTGYVFYNQSLDKPELEYCYTKFLTKLDNGQMTPAFIELSKKIIPGNIVPSFGPNSNMLTSNEKDKLSQLCNYTD